MFRLSGGLFPEIGKTVTHVVNNVVINVCMNANHILFLKMGIAFRYD